MRIIKSTETIPVDHPVFCIFGQPGIGKSSLGYSTADPLVLDFDSGAHRAANRRDTMVINAWSDVTELMQTPTALEPYKTIVVDTVGRCLDLMTADIIRETPKLGPNGNLSQQGWGVLKTRFRTWVASLRALGKDVLLIAHDKEDKDGDLRVVRPDIVGGSYGEVMKVADFVAYCYMSGKDRVLDFNPTDRWVGKNPAGWAPFKVPPVAKAQAFMADLVDLGRKALGTISDASALLAQQVEDWRTAIGALTTADDFNRAAQQLERVPEIVKAQIRPTFKARVDAVGVTYDKTQKQYVAKPNGSAPASLMEAQEIGWGA